MVAVFKTPQTAAEFQTCAIAIHTCGRWKLALGVHVFVGDFANEALSEEHVNIILLRVGAVAVDVRGVAAPAAVADKHSLEVEILGERLVAV